MNTQAGRLGFMRRYDLKRFRFTIVPSLIYAGALSVISLGLALLTNLSLPIYLPEFLRSGPFGLAYIYTNCCFAALTIYLAINPSLVMHDGLRDNSWNMYIKFGVKPAALELNKLLVCLCAVLRVYAIGYALTCGIGFLMRNDSAVAGIVDLLLLAVLGALGLIVILLPAYGVSVFTSNGIIIRLLVVVSAAAMLFLLERGGYYFFMDEGYHILTVNDILTPSPTSLSLIAPVVLLIFGALAMIFSRRRAMRYEVEALGEEELKTLGITRDTVIYERNSGRYDVVISGPEVHGVEDAQVQDSISDEED